MEQTKQQMGDGKDNYGQAAAQGVKAARSAAQGAKATNAAIQTVNSGRKVGKAVAGVAKGAAAGGPVGAIIAAAWSLRRTIFKILVCIALAIVLLVVAVLSLPCIIFNAIFNNKYSPLNGVSTLVMAFNDLSDMVGGIIQSAFEKAMDKVMDIISVGDYDYTLSMRNLTYYSPTASDYDIYYILSAYSVSEMQKDATPDGLRNRLNSVTELMFPIHYVVEKAETWFEALTGWILKPVKYIVCTISPFNNSSILTAFNLDLNAKYGEFNITYGEAIEYMSDALKMTLNGEENGRT